MVVSKEITRLENSSVKLDISIGKADVRENYDSLISEYTKNLQIPGFRKGKVPKSVLEQKFGPALKEEALSRIIEKSMEELFADNKDFPDDARPLPYSNPRVEDEPKLDLDSDLRFSLVYDVLPKVDVPEWKGLEVEVPNAEVGSEDINRELEALRERNALVTDKSDDAAAAIKDVATIDYAEIEEDGKPGEERKDFVFTLGGGTLFYKFDEEIAGMKKGETREFEKTYAEDFDDPVLAGKTKKFRVTLKALKEKQLPALDDDLAQDVNDKYKTIDDLKADIRKRLSKNLENRVKDISVSNILEKLLEKTDIIIPESMIRVELEGRRRRLARQFNMSEEQVIDLLAASGKGHDEILEEWRPAAKKALQSRLIVETLIKNMALEAADGDVEQRFKEMAGDSDTSIDEIRRYYAGDDAMEYLKEDIKERKLYDILLEGVIIKKGTRQNYIDLVGNNN